MELLGKGEELIEFVKDRPGHDFRYSLDTTKAKRELGWEAKTSFDEGLKETVEWYIEHLKWAQDKVACLNDYWKRVYVRQ